MYPINNAVIYDENKFTRHLEAHGNGGYLCRKQDLVFNRQELLIRIEPVIPS
jgi:hypothetical protein